MSEASNTRSLPIPAVDKLLRHPLLEEATGRWRREMLAQTCRQVLSELRQEARAGRTIGTEDEIAQRVVDELEELSGGSLRRIINGTGVVLNTNLGRAPLAEPFVDRLKDIVCSYSNLEIDLESGKRGKRSARLARLLLLLTGAEAAIVVNNNAAAVLLAVNCLARDREVVVSRGELIEIGGSFRLPDVIESAGARLKEVGTTNRTRIADYKKAVNPQTGLLMRCHRSNFEVTGFTEEVALEQLVELSVACGVPVLEDLGSGVLYPLKSLGLTDEPTVQETVATGCDLVTFSGDKLLGGPQAGVIVGKKALVDQLASHPLYRALRPDKITISLLEQTLTAYLTNDPAQLLPALALMSIDQSEIQERVSRFVDRLQPQLKQIELSSTACTSVIGGGSVPGQEKPSWGVRLRAPVSAAALAKLMRMASTPVVAVVQDEEVRIDFRTVLAEQEALLVAVLQAIDAGLSDNDSNKCVP